MPSLVPIESQGSHRGLAPLTERPIGQLVANATVVYPGIEQLTADEIYRMRTRLYDALSNPNNHDRVAYSSVVDVSRSSFWRTARVELTGPLVKMVDGSQNYLDDPVDAIVQQDKNRNLDILVGNRSLLDLVVAGMHKDDSIMHQVGPEGLNGYKFSAGRNARSLEGRGYADSMGAIVGVAINLMYQEKAAFTVGEATKGTTRNGTYPVVKRAIKLMSDPVIRERLLIDILRAVANGVNGESTDSGMDPESVVNTGEGSKKITAELHEVAEAYNGEPFGDQFAYSQELARHLTPELALLLEGCGLSDGDGLHIEAAPDPKTGFVELTVTPAKWEYDKLQFKIKQTMLINSDFVAECVPFPTPTAQSLMEARAKLLAADITASDALASNIYTQLGTFLIMAKSKTSQTNLQKPELLESGEVT